MLACSELMTGADTQRVVAAVHAAEAAGAADPAVGGYLQLARGQLRSRMPGQWERWRLVADVPSDVTAVPTSRDHELAWRGSVFALAGRFDDGIADLREFTGRVREGAAEFGDGMFHAVLGDALWMRGDREQARIPIGVAVESRLASAHPLVQAIAPLRRIGTGDLDQARRLLADAFDVIRRAPFPPAIQVAGVVGTVIELVDGAPERRRALLPLLRRTLATARSTCPARSLRSGGCTWDWPPPGRARPDWRQPSPGSSSEPRANSAGAPPRCTGSERRCAWRTATTTPPAPSCAVRWSWA